jgi:hypothetical protein
MRTKTEYAVYKGDKFLTIGTLHEIAEYLGITYGSLKSLKSTGRVYIFVKLGDDKE